MTTLIEATAAAAPRPPHPAPADSGWDDGHTPPARPRLVSLFAAAPGLSMAAFLHAAQGNERFYWAEPGDERIMAGAGIAAHLTAAPTLPDDAERLPMQRFADIEAQARDLFAGALLAPLSPGGGAATPGHPARPRLFGGFAFQDDFVPDNTWSAFNPAEFVLPHYQLARREDETYLTINALVGPDEDPDDARRALAEALAARLAAPAPAGSPAPVGPVSLRYPMTEAQWATLIERATSAIRLGGLQKVVLARVCEARAAAPIDAAALLAYLDDSYGDSYRFLFEPCPGHAFVGATPELLVRKEGRAVRTMALAGSIARGRTAAEDDALAAHLLASTKDRHEHQFVVAAIRDHLGEVAGDLTAPDAPDVLRLRNIQHLHTPIAGRLRRDESVLRLVRRLHPTPAMGGVPPERALAFLRDGEPVPRGWYAAPIGWIDGALDGVFAVGIRSAVTQHERAWLYAGAGIVAESQPEREWAETALKFRPMLGALGAAELS